MNLDIYNFTIYYDISRKSKFIDRMKESRSEGMSKRFHGTRCSVECNLSTKYRLTELQFMNTLSDITLKSILESLFRG